MAKVFLTSVRHAKVVILLTLVVTMLFAGGLLQVYVRSADYDLMPDGHPSTKANQRALNEVPGFRSIETIWIQTSDNSNITSPNSIRAAEEVEDYFRARVPEIAYTYSLAYLVKLVNYTASGVPNPVCSEVPTSPSPPIPVPTQTCTPAKPPDLAAFKLPPDDLTIQRDYSIIERAQFSAIEGVVNESFTGTLVVFMYDFNLTKAGPQKVLPASAEFLHTAQRFRETDCAQMKTRTADNRPLVDCSKVYVLGEAINAHMTELANQDFIKWGPIVFVATLVVLFFAFRDTRSTLIAAAAFTIGLVWTYGLMGYLHMPLTFFGLLIVPITLGVGKEYAIYVTNQYLEYTANGEARERAFELVGHRAGAALLVASVTSIAGVATMILANFFVMRDLAILTSFSFLALFVIAITFIPAAHSLGRARAVRHVRYRPVKWMGSLAHGLRRRRAFVIVGVVLITAVLAVESLNIEEYFGISGGFKKGDYLESSYRYYNTVLGGSGTELVVVEGDVASPQTIQYLRDLDASFKKDHETIPKSSNVNSLIIALEVYYGIHDGLANPAALNPQLNRTNIPTNRDQVHNDIQAMFDSPAWSSLAALFVGRDENMAVTHVFYHIKTETYDGLDTDWKSLNADIDRVQRPGAVTGVNLVGTQDTFYLYVTYGQPWLEYVSYAASFLTLLLAIAVVGRPRDFLSLIPPVFAYGAYFLGLVPHSALLTVAITTTLVTIGLLWYLRARDVAAIMIPMLLASIWWAGLLPLFGIKASLTLMLPTVFLISVGSDYAIQYVWNYRQIGSMREVYESTGKANLYVVFATVLAFLLFVPMKLVLSSQGALAAALAILTIFVVTTLLVPLFYRTSLPRSKAVTYSAPPTSHLPPRVTVDEVAAVPTKRRKQDH